MKRHALTVALLLGVSAPGAFAQPATTPPSSNSTMTPSGTGQAAASGDNNQAVATTNANAAQPAHGANSFSKKEAGRRIAKHGFTQVSDPRKDENGVWRGTAMLQGSQVGVWLDYKGNVGHE